MSLTGKQFGGLAAQANDPDIGGFTVSTKGKDAGKSPASRYLVGQGKEETSPSGSMTGGDLKDYASRNSKDLGRPEHFLGGWDHEGTGYMDVSKGFDKSPEGHASARQSTLDNNEMAYGETDSKRQYVGDHNNPFHPDNQEGDITSSGGEGQGDAWVSMARSSKKGTSPITPREGMSFS